MTVTDKEKFLNQVVYNILEINVTYKEFFYNKKTLIFSEMSRWIRPALQKTKTESSHINK